MLVPASMNEGGRGRCIRFSSTTCSVGAILQTYSRLRRGDLPRSQTGAIAHRRSVDLSARLHIIHTGRELRSRSPSLAAPSRFERAPGPAGLALRIFGGRLRSRSPPGLAGPAAFQAVPGPAGLVFRRLAERAWIRTRGTYRSSGFQDRCLRPLGHLSVDCAGCPAGIRTRYLSVRSRVLCSSELRGVSQYRTCSGRGWPR